MNVDDERTSTSASEMPHSESLGAEGNQARTTDSNRHNELKFELERGEEPPSRSYHPVS